MLLSAVLEGKRKPAQSVFLHATGNAYATGVRERLQAGRYVHAIAEDVAAFGDYVADF